MKILELIEHLKTFDPELAVWSTIDGEEAYSFEVEELQQGKVAKYPGGYVEILSDKQYAEKVKLYTSLEGYLEQLKGITTVAHATSRFWPNKQHFESADYQDCIYFK